MPDTDPDNELSLSTINARIRTAFATALPDDFTDTPDDFTDTPDLTPAITSDPTAVTPPVKRHRLARSAIGPGDSHRNHALVGQSDVPACPIKATHVEVDAEAWRFLRAQAVRWHLPLSEVVGRLVRAAIRGGVPVEDAVASIDRIGTTGRRARAFTRLYGIDDELWASFRAEAIEAGVTTARAVGILAEFTAAEIRRQTETAEPSREYPARSRDGTAFGGVER